MNKSFINQRIKLNLLNKEIILLSNQLNIKGVKHKRIIKMASIYLELEKPKVIVSFNPETSNFRFTGPGFKVNFSKDKEIEKVAQLIIGKVIEAKSKIKELEEDEISTQLLATYGEKIKVLKGLLYYVAKNRKEVWYCKGYVVNKTRLQNLGYKVSTSTTINVLVQIEKHKKWGLEARIKGRIFEDYRQVSEVWRNPAWLKRFPNMEAQIKKIYKLARSKSINGFKYEVDHIHPVNHPLSCGLTVPWNLQVISAEENKRKSNKLRA